jgi:hypothetical protein
MIETQWPRSPTWSILALHRLPLLHFSLLAVNRHACSTPAHASATSTAAACRSPLQSGLQPAPVLLLLLLLLQQAKE